MLAPLRSIAHKLSESGMTLLLISRYVGKHDTSIVLERAHHIPDKLDPDLCVHERGRRREVGP